MSELAIVDYGAGNVQSVIFAFERLGVKPQLTADATQLRTAKHVVFPGVGAAGAALKHFEQTGLHDVLLDLQQPVLGICLGLQMMCNHTEEDGTTGLGVFDTSVVHFEHDLKVPHMGWNVLENMKSPLFKNIDSGAEVYFVHSYYAKVECTDDCNDRLWPSIRSSPTTGQFSCGAVSPREERCGW